MAFLIHSTDDGRVLPWEYYAPANAVTYKVGLALTAAMAVCTGTTKPTYICMTDDNTLDQIPVVRVQSDTVFETTNTAALTSVAVGDKVTLHTDGMQVTATKTSGVAEVVYKEADDVGSKVRVRF